ncbi:VOC family protein [Flexithrix dorotheae]|uniref:VOC family protein n=1 Tax=Flexithrix dorotheae TaxID=70993 RepID=UPI0003774FB7|nr:VOC family protein [Flexithrix dorotheae]
MKTKTFKPKGYNSLSPYLIVDDANKLVDFLIHVFDAKEFRRFEDENGRISHVELKLDDSILMISNSTPVYPAHKTMLHYYVDDVRRVFERAIAHGGEVIQEPVQKENDPDMRGSFYDFAGNYWSIGTQVNPEK